MKYRLTLDVADLGPRSAPGRWGAWSCNSPTPAEHSHSDECPGQPGFTGYSNAAGRALQSPQLTAYGVTNLMQWGLGWLPPGMGPCFSSPRLDTELPLPLLLQASPQKPVLLANLKTVTVESHEPLSASEQYSWGPSLFSPAAVWLRVRQGRVLMQTYSSTRSFHKITVHFLSSKD